MSFQVMKIRTVTDASTALFSLLEPLRRAANFADLIIADNTFKLELTRLVHLVATYRCQALEQRIGDMANDLRDLEEISMCRDDRDRLETLLRDPNLNFYKPANALHEAFVSANAITTTSKRLFVLTKVIDRVPKFQESAESALSIVLGIREIVTRYTEHGQNLDCIFQPTVPRFYIPFNFSSKLVVYGPSEYASTELRALSPRVYADRNNWSEAAVCDEEQPERRVKFALTTPATGISVDRRFEKENKQPTSNKIRSRKHLKTQPRLKERFSRTAEDFTVFISHSGRDKQTMAIPLHKRLKAAGVSSFVDKESLVVGENAHDAMKRAMETAPIGVFIVSPEAAARRWPMKEMICFLNRLEKAKKAGGHPPILIPVFYRMNVSQCTGDDLFNIESSTSHRTVFRKEGFYARLEAGEASMGSVRRSLQKLARITGLENDEGASNGTSHSAHDKRERLIARVEKAVLDAVKRL